ncbi:hypothetical protein [Martelella sp. AD-3]|nr:hypothetical protein [Martelella sp. AD-3]
MTRFLPETAPLPMPDQMIERPRRKGLVAILLSPVLAWQRPRAARSLSKG